jgi:secreted Zn-dependent insulinase-like peptidase
MTLHTSGFSDRQLMLCEEILSFIQKLNIKPATFAAVKEKVASSLKNTLLNKPINQLFADVNILLQENTFSQESILAEVETLTLRELHQQARTYFEKIHIEGLAVGNWSVAQIQSFHSKVVDCFKDMNKVLKSSRNIALISRQKLCIQHAQSHKEHAIVLYFQAPSNSNQNRGLYIAIEKLLSPIVFDELRNKRNLGYLVGCGYFPVNRRPGLALYVQSPSHSSNNLYTAMTEVLEEFVQNIEEFAPIFDNFKESLKKQFRVFDANTNQLAQRLWMDFDDLNKSTENNEMEYVIDNLTFDLFKKGCENLTADSFVGKAIFITEPKTEHSNSFAGFEFIEDPTVFKHIVKYQ